MRRRLGSNKIYRHRLTSPAALDHGGDTGTASILDLKAAHHDNADMSDPSLRPETLDVDLITVDDLVLRHAESVWLGRRWHRRWSPRLS